MLCKLVRYMVQEGNQYIGPHPEVYGSGAARAIVKCETHNWMFDYPIAFELPDAPNQMVLCPIGRIELATDDAIRRIHGHAALAEDEVIARIKNENDAKSKDHQS